MLQQSSKENIMKITLMAGCLFTLFIGSAFAKQPKSPCGAFLEQVPLAQISDSAKSELDLTLIEVIQWLRLGGN